MKCKMITVIFKDEEGKEVYSRKMNFNIELKRELVKQMPTGTKNEEEYKKCVAIMRNDYKVEISED